VVVVSRNRVALLRRCLESLEKSEGRETLQIVVVDNASSDGAAQLEVRHHGSAGYSALERADYLLGRAVFMGKYLGFGAGVRARLAAVFSPLIGFRFGELRYTLPGQKIDGTQL
jgi:glycosyltransferase involved in cell wall biosynthesis